MGTAYISVLDPLYNKTTVKQQDSCYLTAHKDVW